MGVLHFLFSRQRKEDTGLFLNHNVIGQMHFGHLQVVVLQLVYIMYAGMFSYVFAIPDNDFRKIVWLWYLQAEMLLFCTL